jgi:hypothetical protein
VARRKLVGPCHLCGVVTELSYEHVPPRSAFNDNPVWVLRGDVVIRADLENLPRGKQQQRGAGEYTLCHRCNNDTGSWYGTAFAAFAAQAARILLATRGEASLYYSYHILPLRVLKQIVCMFMSTNSSSFRTAHPELVTFVLNRRSVGLPSKYRFYIYYNAGDRARFAGVSGALDSNTRQIRVLTEMTFPPLGYVLCLSGPPPDDRLIEVTHFARYLYDEFRHLPLRVPVLPVFTYFPGDYRDRETVLREARDNQRDGG